MMHTKENWFVFSASQCIPGCSGLCAFCVLITGVILTSFLYYRVHFLWRCDTLSHWLLRPAILLKYILQLLQYTLVYITIHNLQTGFIQSWGTRTGKCGSSSGKPKCGPKQPEFLYNIIWDRLRKEYVTKTTSIRSAIQLFQCNRGPTGKRRTGHPSRSAKDTMSVALILTGTANLQSSTLRQSSDSDSIDNFTENHCNSSSTFTLAAMWVAILFTCLHRFNCCSGQRAGSGNVIYGWGCVDNRSVGGVAVRVVRHMKKVTLRRARLGLGWATVCVCNQPTRTTQPAYLRGSLNRVPASAWVRVAGNTVWSHMACEFP